MKKLKGGKNRNSLSLNPTTHAVAYPTKIMSDRRRKCKIPHAHKGEKIKLKQIKALVFLNVPVSRPPSHVNICRAARRLRWARTFAICAGFVLPTRRQVDINLNTEAGSTSAPPLLRIPVNLALLSACGLRMSSTSILQLQSDFLQIHLEWTWKRP